MISSFMLESSLFTIFVIAWLSLYFVATLWVFFYKSYALRRLEKLENEQLQALIKKDIAMPRNAALTRLVELSGGSITRELLNIWKSQMMKNATKSLTLLSVVSSTAPFIGLFGTVVEILEAFAYLGGSGHVSFDVIAPIISKALIATACGILVAIPAYSFFLILKRKTYELAVILQMQIDLLTSHQRN